MALRLAVVGTGFAEQIQIPAFLIHPEIEVVAVVSRRIEKAERVAAQYEIEHAFDRFEDLWKLDRLDAVSIATPPLHHAPMAIEALSHGCHVLCEKPMAMNAKEAEQMLLEARRSGKVHVIDHEFRYTPARALLKELVRSGELGAIHTIRITQYRDMWHDPLLAWNWLFDEGQGGGLLGAMGSHLIDMLLYTFGPVRKVAALLTAGISQRPAQGGATPQKVTADDTLSLLMQLENGAQAVLQLTGVSSQNRGLEVEIHGERAAFLMRGNQELFRLNHERIERIDPPPALLEGLEPRSVRLSENQRRLQPFLALVDDWLQAIDGASPARLPSFADGLAVQRIMDAARQSSQSGQTVQISI